MTKPRTTKVEIPVPPRGYSRVRYGKVTKVDSVTWVGDGWVSWTGSVPSHGQYIVAERRRKAKA